MSEYVHPHTRDGHHVSGYSRPSRKVGPFNKKAMVKHPPILMRDKNGHVKWVPNRKNK